MRRTLLAEYVAARVGRNALLLEEIGNGWPAAATVRDPDGGDEAVAMYLASVGLSGRGRDAVERRIQVKGGHPIEDDGRRTPVLLGVWHEDPLVRIDRPVFTIADARRRVGHTTQVSVFVPLANLQAASRRGWSAYRSATGEVIAFFVPEILPLALVARDNDIELDDEAVQAAVEVAGLLDEGRGEAPADRAMRAAWRRVRDSQFADRVGTAYDHSCAMCGLALGITEGAHILPVAAAADDNTTNGLTLCPNHHRLFDKHRVAVHPQTRAIVYHPSLLAAAEHEPETARLVGSTLSHLRRAVQGCEPPAEAFLARYEHFAENYKWMAH